MNDGSHCGEDEEILAGYLVLVGVYVAMITYFFNTIGDLFTKSRDNTKIIAFTGLIVIGIAYIYRLIHLAVYYSNGQGLYIFDLLYRAIKSLCEFIIVTFIVSISWGWSLTHLKHDKTYLYFGAISALINLISIIYASLIDQNVEIYHLYDSKQGVFTLSLKVVIVGISIVGIIRTLRMSVGNVRNFFKKFALIAVIYLSVNPLTVIFAEYFLPNYMHNEFITFTEQIIHLIASFFLCRILANPESTYRKLSLKQEDNPLKMQNYKKY